MKIKRKLLSGCASMMNGTYQNFKVATNNNFDVDNTCCNLTNYQGAWFAAPNTTLLIHRVSNVLDIRCENPNQNGSTKVKPDFQGLYLDNDLLFGAIISGLKTITTMLSTNTRRLPPLICILNRKPATYASARRNLQKNLFVREDK